MSSYPHLEERGGGIGGRSEVEMLVVVVLC